MSGSTLSPRKIAILENPTPEGAMEFWPHHLLGEPIGDAAMAGVHKARLLWPGSSKKMVKESKKWLIDHGYRPEG